MRVKWFSPGAGSNKKLKGSLDPSVACSRARLFGRDDSKQVKRRVLTLRRSQGIAVHTPNFSFLSLPSSHLCPHFHAADEWAGLK
jgi:hypothetical protein